ncbi:hypothetical protein C9J85_18975 [Haloferax sp. wsp5]|nr:hypothetical protein C9J85_18975 [Haloferax sp. wsp5]
MWPVRRTRRRQSCRSDDDGHPESLHAVRIGGSRWPSGDGERARVGAADDSANGLFSTARHCSTRSLAGGVLDNVRVVVDTCDRTGARSEVLTAQREQSLHSVFDAVVVHGRSL